MTAPRRIHAYTLLELLVVLVIFGVILLLTSGFTQRARDTFIAQQYIKTATQNARILRRKSMLITRNSSEREWVQGIGFRFEIDNATKQWQMLQVKALSNPVSNNYFYQSFPSGDPCLELEWDTNPNSCGGYGSNELILRKIDNTTAQILPLGMRFVITNGPTNCTTALTVIYESINGKLHAYCRNTSGIDVSLGSTLDMKIQIEYMDGERYRLKLNLKNNGEINATTT